MDPETNIAAPKSTQPDEAAERVAAFKRGAPIPKAAVKAAPARAKPARPAVAEPSKSVTPVEPKAGSKAESSAESEPDPQAAKPVRSPRAPRAPRAQKAERVQTDVVQTDAPKTDAPKTDAPRSDDASSEGAAMEDGSAPRTRPRRRRGGRGRGRGSARPAAVSDGEDDGEGASPGETTLETQRDDAWPDAEPQGDGDARPAGTSSRRRRGPRGGAGTKPAADQDDRPSENGAARQPGARTRQRTGEGGGQKADQKSSPKSDEKSSHKAREKTPKAKSMTVEEQVAAGGPTRGIRSTRSRTGRVGGDRRRRRDPIIVPPRITDKLMVITEHGDRDQIAVLEEDVLVQHYVTRTGATSMVGNVYLGRVQNVLPGMEAAFVDIGRGRNGVLYAGEVNYSPEDLEGPAPRIEQVLKSGQAVMVQVTKDPMGGKGARLTAQISLPGRFLVFAPNQSLSGISRRLADDERKRLKAIMRQLKPDGDGVIVRTAAEGASDEAITRDLERLVRVWDEIQRKTKKVKAPEVLYEEPELTVRVFRDLFTDEEYRQLVTDSPRVHEKIMDYVRDVAPDLEPKITLHQGKLPAFEEHRIEEQIHKALDRKVWLPSGGYLIIERTEAMTIVDVNTGKSVGKTNLEETVVNTNLEASKEVARQLRLRDIGGIIVVDFIDMLLEKNKTQVENTMKDALALDKTRSQVFEIGPLGLMQVTRKRVSGGLVESFSETCPTCEGRGILINYEV
jgi:ribonuclease E